MIRVLLPLLLFPGIAFGQCNWKTDISPTVRGTYDYQESCHLAVGQMKADFEVYKKEVDLLKEALDDRNTALDLADDRTELWVQTSKKLEDDLQRVDQYKSKNLWLSFGAGVLTAVVAGFAMRSITR